MEKLDASNSHLKSELDFGCKVADIMGQSLLPTSKRMHVEKPTKYVFLATPVTRHGKGSENALFEKTTI